jgi:site-specific DNA-methyltransferase (adenine-specific)
MNKPSSIVYNEDCIEGMKRYPDKHFDLAIVDPPYGIGFSDYERGSMGVKVKERHTKNGKKQWDNNGVPTDEYFKELKRVSVNQIVWGGNYFPVLWGGGL